MRCQGCRAASECRVPSECRACLGCVGESNLAAIERELEVGGALLAVLLVLGIAEEHMRCARRPPVHHAGRHRAPVLFIVFGNLAEAVEQVGLRRGRPRNRDGPRRDASDGHEALARGREECEHGGGSSERRDAQSAIRRRAPCGTLEEPRGCCKRTSIAYATHLYIIIHQ